MDLGLFLGKERYKERSLFHDKWRMKYRGK